MADNKSLWVPIHVRLNGAEEIANYTTFVEEPTPGLQHAFETFFKLTLGKIGTQQQWWPDENRWAELHRATGLGEFPPSRLSAQKLSQNRALILVSCVDAIAHIQKNNSELSSLIQQLQRAFEQSRFAWRLDAYGQATRVLAPGLESLITAAMSNMSSSDHIREALRAVVRPQPNPAVSVQFSQKALEAALLKAFGMKGSLGLLVGELRTKRKKFKLPRSSRADSLQPPSVDPHDTVRGIIEAVWFGNPERHAGGTERLSRDDALSILGLSNLIIDWLDRNQIIPDDGE